MAGKRKSPPKSAAGTSGSKSRRRVVKAAALEEQSPPPISEEEWLAEEIGEEEEGAVEIAEVSRALPRPFPARASRKHQENDGEEESKFIGETIDKDEAIRRWPHRYLNKVKGKEVEGSQRNEEKMQAKNHYQKAIVDGVVFALEDCAYVMAGEGEDNYICKIVEMFEGVDKAPYITAQWFYRAKDTVIKSCANLVNDEKRIFLSTIKDDNPLDCLLQKIEIVQLPLNIDSDAKLAALSKADYYYDMVYHVPFSSLLNAQHNCAGDGNESDSTISSETSVAQEAVELMKMKEMKLLDLFSGCGAMSTGLCLGANLAGVQLVTKWAVDINPYACQSLQLNHPETEVRNEKAEDFLALLKEWKKLCVFFSLTDSKEPQQPYTVFTESDVDDEDGSDVEDDPETFEVDRILSICYGDPNGTKKNALYFKIRWKGYKEDADTWEPIDGLSHCKDKLKEFVTNGYNSKILPLPGDADVICGGPPCQGISGFNRFRNKENPLDDVKNQQLIVYMDIVDYLKPRYVLMENVVDILRFAGGFLARYALGRLVGMNYQARIGLMAAGAYGLPQFRMRMFMWGAHNMEMLPQYPLPTHNVVARGNTPLEFESNAVAYDDGHKVELEKKLFLGDAISDLPPVENDESRDEMPYGRDPETEFQRFIRLKKEDMPGISATGSKPSQAVLYDHRPLQLNEDDYQRVCHVPVKKGACFRDFKGVRVRPDNKVEWDPDVERVLLPSGKPLVPDYAMSFIGGTSSKPFSRLWWDETVPTVVTRAEPHNQSITHPEQNRVLTIRENARLQGFPDYYQLCGPIKERYIQVGNAVAVPVARALGYALGLASKGLNTEQPLLKLPQKFPILQDNASSP